MIQITDNRDPKRSKNGRYYSCNFYYVDESGKKRRTPTRKFYVKTLGEARREREKYREECEQQLNHDPNMLSYMTVADYALRFHEKRKRNASLSKQTIIRDASIINTIVSLFPDKALRDLTTIDIEDAYEELKEQGKSEDAIHKVHKKLKQILSDAERLDIILRNPANKIVDVMQPKSRERKALTEEQAIEFASALRRETQNGRIVAIWIALATGMRKGELLGLQWQDVDLTKGVITVCHQLNKSMELVEPKKNSKRPITIDEGTIAYLGEWKAFQSLLYFQGEPVPDDFPVCCNDRGGFADHTNFDRFRRAFFVKHGLGRYTKTETFHDENGHIQYRATGYEGFNLHELRHTQATLLIGKGLDIKTVQLRLGHSSAAMTLDTYAHFMPTNQDAAKEYMTGIMQT